MPYEYDPGHNHMMIGDGPAAQRRHSPLTDADLTELIGAEGDAPGSKSKPQQIGERYRIAVVSGTDALAISRVPEVLREVARRQDFRLEPTTLDALPAALAANDRKHRVYLAEVDHVDVPDLALTLERLRPLAANRAVAPVIMVVRAVSSRPLAVPPDRLFRSIALRRFSPESLRAWYDFPFDEPKLRQEVYRLTSGWPLLLEWATAQAAVPRPVNDVLAALHHPFPAVMDAGQFLDAVGLDPDARRLCREWIAVALDSREREDGGGSVLPFHLQDLQSALGTDVGALLDRLAALDVAEQRPDGWILDSAVAEALVRTT